MKILLTKRRALGDTVLLSSSVAALKTALPDAQISVVVPEVFRPLLEGNPQIRNLWSFEEGAFSLLRQIRRERFDHHFRLHASTRPDPLFRFSGARAKHFQIHDRATEIRYRYHPNALEWDSFAFREVFGDKVPSPAPEPKLYLTAEELKHGELFWRAAGLDPKKVIFLGLGASRPTKRWLPAHFARLAELLREQLDLYVAFVPGPGEDEAFFTGQVLDEMRARGLRAFAAGKGDFYHASGMGLRSLAAALAACRAYVGNDSGPKHMAVAVGCPTITLFGPEDPVEWHPYDQSRHPMLFLNGLKCRLEDGGRWCGIPVCEKEQHRCMRDISPKDVLARLTVLLSRPSNV